MIIAIFVGILFIVYAYRHPALSFALVFSMFGIEQLAGSMFKFFLIHQSLINLFIGLLVLIGITSKITKGKLVFSTYFRSAWVVIAIYFLSFCSLVWTPDPAIAWDNWSKAFPYVITLIFLMPLLIQNMEDLETGLLYLALIGLVTVILISVFGEYKGRGIVMADARSTGNPLAVAQLGAYVIFTAVLQRFSGVARILVLARWGIVIVALLVMGFSGSRGQLLFLFATLLLMLPAAQEIKNPISFVSIGLIILLLGAIGNWIFSEYLQGDRRWSAEMLQHDANGRFKMALGLLQQWIDSPAAWLFGLGTSAAFDIVGFYPHIVPLEILGEEGFFGLVLFVFFVYRSWRAFFKLMGRFKNHTKIRGQIATIGAITAFEFLLIWKQGSLLNSVFFFSASIILQTLEISSRNFFDKTKASSALRISL